MTLRRFCQANARWALVGLAVSAFGAQRPCSAGDGSSDWAVAVKLAARPGPVAVYWVGLRNASARDRVLCLPVLVSYTVIDSERARGQAVGGMALSPHRCRSDETQTLVEPGTAVFRQLRIPADHFTQGARLRFDLFAVELCAGEDQSEIRLHWEQEVGEWSRRESTGADGK